METLRIPSLEDIHRAYRQGEEAVVALFMRMVAQHAELMAVVQQQQEAIGVASGGSGSHTGRSTDQEQQQQRETAFQ